jgi:hypothetical protein
VQDAHHGDAETSRETLITAAEQIEAVLPDGDGLQEVVGDKGYHSNQSLIDLEAVGVRSYISEPHRDIAVDAPMSITTQATRYAQRRLGRRLGKSISLRRHRDRAADARRRHSPEGLVRRLRRHGAERHPFVGGMKNVAEVVRGRDFIRDKRLIRDTRVLG